MGMIQTVGPWHVDGGEESFLRKATHLLFVFDFSNGRLLTFRLNICLKILSS